MNEMVMAGSEGVCLMERIECMYSPQYKMKFYFSTKNTLFPVLVTKTKMKADFNEQT